jgi:hypothetical protein
MRLLTFVILIFTLQDVFGQKRLELLETNIPIEKITSYSDSYLWTKNWWLTNGLIVDTSKGGNAIALGSSLSKTYIDSIAREFRRVVPPEIVRFGNLVPKINYSKSAKQVPYIKASIYEINESSAKLIIQYLIEFGSGRHNRMNDISSVAILDVKSISPLTFEKVSELYQRKPSLAELDITPPQVSKK